MIKYKRNIGMAMLEVLIAMAIVAVGVLPLVYLQVKADRSVVSSYTKVEHNAVALSIMDLVSSDANKNDWTFNLASGDCDTGCNDADEWRKVVTDELLTSILPSAGSSLVCITQEPVTSVTAGAAPVARDRSIKMTVTLWWYSAGRGKADIGGDTQNDKSQEGAFTAADCNQLNTFADKLNIDTVAITRIF